MAVLQPPLVQAPGTAVSCAAAPDCTAADVWEAILLLEIEPEVGVEESAWGVIKALFETHP